MASVTTSYPQVLALAAAFVAIGGAAVAVMRWGTRLYRRTAGSRRDLGRRLNQLATGVTIRYVEERFGAPVFARAFDLPPSVASTPKGLGLPEDVRRPTHELVYRDRHAWIQILADANDAVVRFAITVTDPRLRFQVRELTVFQLTARLGHSRFSEIKPQIDPDGRSLWIGARRRGYSESYWFGNPGNYQHFVLSHNDAGTGDFGFSSEINEVGWHQDGALKFENPTRDDLPTFDPAAPYVDVFRTKTTVNTLTVLGANYDQILLAEPRGPDADYVRVVVPDLRTRRQMHRRVRRMNRKILRELEEQQKQAEYEPENPAPPGT